MIFFHRKLNIILRFNLAADIYTNVSNIRGILFKTANDKLADLNDVIQCFQKCPVSHLDNKDDR